MVDILELPTAISQVSPSHAGDEAKCSQPDLLRLLAISCLGKAIYDGPWFGAHDDQMNYCATITNVTQNIDTLTKEFNLPRLLRHVQSEYSANTGSLVSGLRYAEGKLLVSRNGEESEITSSHIKGEAYEILCAIVFNCKKKTPLNIKNYYHELHEDCEDVRCSVKNVFLSEKKFGTGSLHWPDNANDQNLESFGKRIAKYLDGIGAPGTLVETFIEELRKNIAEDLGFDLLVELEEESMVDSNPHIHLILAQCKYRSNQFAEVNMAEYIGKYYPLVHLLDQINSAIHKAGRSSSLMLCPFFWMSTQIRQDPMNYFSTLCQYGRVKFYGNMAMSDDNTVCNLIENIHDELTCWKKRIISESNEISNFKYKDPRNPRCYQEKAIQSVETHFEGFTPDTLTMLRYASVIMATGSGKTLTSFLSSIKLQICLHNTLKEKNIAASLHLSPMIRLVMQNAHEWLAEELAREREKMRMIYYCVCSLKKEKNMISLSGCTAVRLITSENLFSVFKHHKDTHTLHYCRFFTTYQGGKVLMKTMRRINLELYQRVPTAPLFGVTVRDEAHTAVGRGSKSYSASLYLPTYIGLSFTASPKYESDNVHMMVPDETPENQEFSLDQNATYLSIPSSRIFPQIDIEKLRNFEGNNEQTLNGYDTKQWSPIDLLSEDMLFRLENNTGGDQYDWSYFQNQANNERRGIVVFYVTDEIVYTSPDHIECYDIVLDDDGNPEYFGVVRCSNPETGIYLEIDHNSICYGVNKELNKIFVPWNERRGFSIHDMTGLGPKNRIGPVIHKLGYQECMELNCLAKPRLIMLERRKIPQLEYQRYNVESTEYLDAIFGKSKVSDQKMQEQIVVKSPNKVDWRLTIDGNIVDGTAHHFRSMKLLLDCFMLEESEKPIRTALVFCLKTEESKICKRIFDALLDKYARGRFPETEEFFTGIIYTSDASAEDEDDFDMSYEDQQDTISCFCQARRGVLFNVKLVGIGVDLPSIDAALIVNPGKSPSDITQKDGRALRVDPKVPDKIATIIVPSWDFSDTSHDDASVDANAPCTPAASEFTEGPSIIQRDPSTPMRTSTGLEPPRTPVNTNTQSTRQSWSAPVMNSFEEKFWLQVRVLKAMMDEDIDMITSIIEGSLEAEKSGKAEPDSATTAKGLLKNIMGDSKGKPHVPVYDESFSEFLLSAWGKIEVDPNATPRDPRTGAVDLRKIRHEQKSRIFLLIACCACCHHRHVHGDYDFADTKDTYLWSSGVEPFNDRMPLQSILDRESHIDWSIVGLESFDGFREAVLKRGGRNHYTSKDYKKSFTDLGDEKDAIINAFFEFLRSDIQKERPTIMAFMEILCESLPGVFHGFTCDQHTHNLEGCGLHDLETFKENFEHLLTNDWMRTVKRSQNRGQSRSTGTKRSRFHSAMDGETGACDEDDAILSPMSQPDQPVHDGNSVQNIRANEQGIPSAAGTSAPRSLQGDMDAAMSRSPPPSARR